MPADPKFHFRRQAIDAKICGIFGGAVISSNPMIRHMAAATVLFVFILGLLVCFGSYERRERVPGYLMPTAGLVRVVPPRVGVITSVKVADGDEVVEGQPLFSVSALRAAAGGVDADAVQVEVLERERANVEARRAREQQLSENRASDSRHPCGAEGRVNLVLTMLQGRRFPTCFLANFWQEKSKFVD